MSIDLNNLSSDELFELAKQRAQQEQEQARLDAVRDKLEKLERRRQQIADEHRRGLAIIDNQLEELKKRRTNIVVEYEKGMAAIDAEIRELHAGAPEQPASKPDDPGPITAPAPDKEAPAVAKPPPTAATEPVPAKPTEPLTRRATVSDQDLIEAKILELMAGKPSISTSLLKERLKAEKLDTSNLYKILEKLQRDRRITRQSGDNYALARRR